MRVIGLTGGIGSGKSTVAGIIAGCGIPVIDADELARDAVLAGSRGLQLVVEAFGPGVLQADGTLDRVALAETIFADPSARRKLESILHPAIKALAEKRLNELREKAEPVVFYMAPLLIEAGAMDRVDEVWVVYVDTDTQLARTRKRDSISREAAEKRLAAQMPMDEKKSYARIVIDNSGGIEELREKVTGLLKAEKLGTGSLEP